MAVPKQKQSHARTTQRRSQHKIERADVQRVPAVPQPSPSPPGLPGVRQLQGSRGHRPGSGRADRLRAPGVVTVAVDAGGADLGPREVAAGAARAAANGIQVLLFGPAGEIGAVPDGVEVVDAPVSIAKKADPANAVRTTPEASIVQATRAVADGRAQAFVSGGSTGLGARGRAVQPPARPRRVPPGARAAAAEPGPRADPAARRRGQRDLPSRAPRAVRAHGIGVRPGRARDRLPARRAPVQRRGARARARRSWSRCTSSSRARAAPA